MSDDGELSESGAPIYRHKEPKSGFKPAFGNEDNIDAITDHIKKYVGDPAMVFHEMISDLVHIDVHHVKPTREHNFHTLITSGMSDLPMEAPEPGLSYAELMICLPPEWPLSEKAFEDENNYWPIRLLKTLARFPHEYETWLFASHSLPNGDPPEPFADNTRFCCSLIMSPVLFEEGFGQLRINSEKTIHFLSLVPIYKEEMDFKLKKGFDALVDRLDKYKVNELLDLGRKNTCKKFLGLF